MAGVTARREPAPTFWSLGRSLKTRVKDRIVHPYGRVWWPDVVKVDAMSRDELLAFRQQRLESLVNHAVAHVPFYRRWASESGFRPGDPVDLNSLPVTSKKEYLADIEDFQSDAYPVSEMEHHKTSGSSGDPFKFRKHRRNSDYSYCCLWRALHRFGLRPGDRRVYVWGRRFQFASNPVKVQIARARFGLRDWLNESHSIDAYNLTDRSVHEDIERIDRFAPAYLHGYVSSLYIIANALLEKGRTLRAPLTCVITESEKLYDFQREALARAFKCPILEHYGSTEMGNMAEPDPQGHMRINEDLVIIERLPSGEVAITNLMSESFPFIRYRQGDLIESADEVPPGLPYACLRGIIGRTVDLIPVSAGGHVHGRALTHTINPHLAYVVKYQIHQVALEHVIVRLIVRKPLPESIQETIRTDLRSLMGRNARIDIQIVDEIKPSPSGKFRWVLSDIAKNAEAPPGQSETPAA